MMGRGYGASPVAWKNLVIAVAGGEGHGVMAFDQESGEVVWKALDGGGYSSPVIATVDGVADGTPDGDDSLAIIDAEGAFDTLPESLWQPVASRIERIIPTGTALLVAAAAGVWLIIGVLTYLLIGAWTALRWLATRASARSTSS